MNMDTVVIPEVRKVRLTVQREELLTLLYCVERTDFDSIAEYVGISRERVAKMVDEMVDVMSRASK